MVAFNDSNFNYVSIGITLNVRITGTFNSSFAGPLVIPNTVTHSLTTYNVTEIGVGAFKDKTGITSVSLGNIVSIGQVAFSNALTTSMSIIIPRGIKYIGNDAFLGCSGITSMIFNSVDSLLSFTAYKPNSTFKIVLNRDDSILSLKNPCGVAIDLSNNIYIADTKDNIIRKIDGTTGITSIIAGNGTQGVPTVGIATNSPLNRPQAVAVGKYNGTDDGFIYVADTGNHAILRIELTSGNLSIVAGTPGTFGSPTPGPALNSLLKGPCGIAIDTNGNIYIADTENNYIEKIDKSSGNLSIIAGNGTPGSPTNGLAFNSPLYNPTGVAVDNLGRVFIADHLNCRVEMLVLSGGLYNLTIIAGNGSFGPILPGSALGSGFKRPYSIAVKESFIYVSDSMSRQIAKIDLTSNELTIVAGNGNLGYPVSGFATDSPLRSPRAIAVDSANNIYIADEDNNVIEKIEQDGTINVIAGHGYSRISNETTSIAFDGQNNMYIADPVQHVIKMISVETGIMSIFAGNGTQGLPIVGPALNSPLNSPNGIAADDFFLYIADTSNHCIETVNLISRTLSVIAGTPGTSGDPVNGLLDSPRGVSTDGINVYIAATGNNRVVKVSIYGGILTIIAGTGISGFPTFTFNSLAINSDLNAPRGVAWDENGNVYIADTGNNLIERIDIDGNIHNITPITAALALTAPTGVAYDHFGSPPGTIYIADTGNHRIVGKSPIYGDFIFINNTGTFGIPTSGDQCLSSKLYQPGGVAVDTNGNIFVVDTGNNLIEKVVIANSKIYVVAGNGNVEEANTIYNFGNGSYTGITITPDSLNNTVSVVSSTAGANKFAITYDTVNTFDSVNYNTIVFELIYNTPLQISDLVGPTSYHFKVGYGTQQTKYSSTIELTVQCFKEGTKILCLIDGINKYIPIETIKSDVLVKTYKHGYKKVIRLGYSSISCNYTSDINNLYKIPKSNQIIEDLYITGGHSCLVNKLTKTQEDETIKIWNKLHMIDDKYLLLTVLNEAFTKHTITEPVKVYHFVLENENIENSYGVYANGLLVESMSQQFFDNYSNFIMIN